jgi:hypothetical protein
MDGEEETYSCSRWVNELDHADIALSCYSTSADCASRDSDLEWVVLVDVGSALHDAHGLESTSPGTLVGLLDVTSLSWNLGNYIHGDGVGEVSGSCAVDHCLVWASSIRGDDVKSSGDRSAWSDLGKSIPGLGHGSDSSSLGFVDALLFGLLVMGWKDEELCLHPWFDHRSQLPFR